MNEPFRICKSIQQIMDVEGGNKRSAIVEILLDARHFCQYNDLNFDECLSISAEIQTDDQKSTEDWSLRDQYQLKVK